MRGRYRRIRWALADSARRWRALAVVLALVAAAYLARDIPNYPANRAAEYRASPAVATAVAAVEPKDRLAFERDLLQYETDNRIKIWTVIITLFTGVAAAAAGFIAWRNLRATQAKLEVDREAQITDRFTKAIDQLGSERTDKDGKPIPNLEVRLGGIYALEKVAEDSPGKYHLTVIEVLTAYVRENAGWAPQQDAPRADIQAVLTIIGRRNWIYERQKLGWLDLHGTYLYGASALSGAHLEGADLRDTRLGRADLIGARLFRANLRGAHLERADLRLANLEGADLKGADLMDAYLKEADLRFSDITQEQVYRAHDHGQGAITPGNWPADWRDQFEKSTNQPPTTPSAP